ncbi:unnamed protein product [Ambrosiozyma monospora]|uniref:Unnamed protein product n=1 Tax=Ambrosiozyma monospora TaxID=43982 RepID=A0A9W6WKL5_AMBMO|nr:unnamed protein product [Ambrosiozyma monospora]
MEDAELAAIRAARLAELQRNAQGGSSSQQSNGKSQSGANPSQAIISQILETEAKERLSRVKLVKPERVQAVENYLVKLYQSGAVRTKITEDDIVEILEKVAKDERRGNQNKIVFNRREVSYGDDDDDDDFFD